MFTNNMINVNAIKATAVITCRPRSSWETMRPCSNNAAGRVVAQSDLVSAPTWLACDPAR